MKKVTIPINAKSSGHNVLARTSIAMNCKTYTKTLLTKVQTVPFVKVFILYSNITPREVLYRFVHQLITEIRTRPSKVT